MTSLVVITRDILNIRGKAMVPDLCAIAAGILRLGRQPWRTDFQMPSPAIADMTWTASRQASVYVPSRKCKSRPRRGLLPQVYWQDNMPLLVCQSYRFVMVARPVPRLVFAVRRPAVHCG